MILVRTHSNRWVARRQRDWPVVGTITLINPGQHPPVYRTETHDIAYAERVLLRDEDCLEVAFALLLAGIERGRAQKSAPESHRHPAAQRRADSSGASARMAGSGTSCIPAGVFAEMVRASSHDRLSTAGTVVS